MLAGIDVVEQAALLAEGLVYWHCFVDGNKRTAWIAMLTFLEANNEGSVEASVADAVSLMTGLTMRRESAATVAAWLRRRLH